MKKFLSIILVLCATLAFASDQRIQYNEKMVGAGHPTLSDTLNRLSQIEHNTDGTHKNLGPNTFFIGKFTGIADALTQIGATESTLIINADTLVSGATTIPSTLSVVVTKGGKFTKSGSGTLTINGPFEAGLYQVFYGFSPGDVTFGAGSVDIVSNLWFGTDQSAIQAALNSYSRVAIFNKGTSYAISGNGLDLNDSQKVEGINWPTLTSSSSYLMSVNRYDGGTTNPADNKKKVHISGLILEHTGGFSEHVHQLNINAISDSVIENNRFLGAKGDGIYLGSSNVGGTERHNENITIRNNFFDGVNNDNRNAISVIDCSGCLIEDNKFVNFTRSNMPGAIDIEPNSDIFHRIRNITVRKNTFNNIGGMGGFIQVYLTSKAYTVPPMHITIEDNYIDNVDKYDTGGSYGLVLGSVGAALETTPDMHVRVIGNTIKRTYRGLYIIGMKQVELTGNSFVRTTIDPLIGNAGAQYKNIDITFRDNLFAELSSNTTTVGNGLRVVEIDRLTFDDNVFLDCGRDNGTFGYALDFASATSSYVTLTNNKFLSPNNRTLTAIQKEVAHTFTPNTNVYLNNRLIGVTGNNFQAGALRVLSNNGATGTVTLAASTTTTVVNNTSVTADSRIFFVPTTANAQAIPLPRVSTITAGTSFTLTHANDANADKTFFYLVLN